MEIIRVILVDNEEIFREGLANLLKDQPHIEVVYQCDNSREAIKKSSEIKPDVVLMNNRLSGSNTKEIIKEISESSPEVKVAIIAHPGTDVSGIEIMKAGARAYLAKTISSADLIKSIELISSGRIIISPLFAEKFLEDMIHLKKVKSEDAAKADLLISTREIEIVKLIAEGDTNKEIAKKLFITENTVKVHVKNILNKLELRNRQQLVAYAVLQNWVTANTKIEGNSSF